MAERRKQGVPTEYVAGKETGQGEFGTETAVSARPSTPAEVDVALAVMHDIGADPSKVGATIQLGKSRNKETGELRPEGPMTTENAERVWVKLRIPSGDASSDVPEIPVALPPIVVQKSTGPRKRRAEKQLVDVTDIQYGYRMHPNGMMVPTHSPESLDILLQITGQVNPDRVIYGGDEADFAEMSRFPADSTHYNAYTLSAGIAGLRMFLAQMRAQAPNAQHTNLASNHGDRPERFIRNAAPQLGGMIPAVKGNTRGYPAFSYPFLMGLEDLDIEYAGGYPASLYRVNDRLFTLHGDKSRANGSTAHMYLGQMDAGMNLMFHHTHRHEEAHHRRRYNALGARGLSAMAFSNGCLADINGAVPSHNNAVDPVGNIQTNRENWVNGFGIVEYQEGDSPFRNQFIQIEEDDKGMYAFFEGRVYRPLGPEAMPAAGYGYQFGQGPIDRYTA